MICMILLRADPVMIIGAGLSAADAILNAQVQIFIKCYFIYLSPPFSSLFPSKLFLINAVTDPAPDPALFVIDLFYVTFTSFFKDEKSLNSRNQGFSSYFCLLMEGSGS